MENLIVTKDISKKRFFSITGIIATLLILSFSAFTAFFGKAKNNGGYVFLSILNSFSSLGVPLVIMLFGANLLSEEKEFTIKSLFKNQILKAVLLFIFWSGVYTLAYKIFKTLIFGGDITFKSIIIYFVNGTSHLRYFYLAISLLLLTPLLRLLTKKENSTTCLYAIIIFLILGATEPLLTHLSCAVKEIYYLASFLSWMKFSSLSGAIALYLLGWYVLNVDITKNFKTAIYVVGGISFIGVILLTTLLKQGRSYSHNYENLLVILSSLALFTLLNNLVKEKESKALDKLSALSFGAFIVHLAVFSVFNYLLRALNIFYLNAILVFIITAIISYGISFVISLIPFINKSTKL